MLDAGEVQLPSARTIASYEARARRLFQLVKADTDAGKTGDIDVLIEYAKQTLSASTWFGRRAALLYAFRKILRKLLAEQDKLQRSLKTVNVPDESDEWDGWRRIVKRIGIWMGGIDRLRNSPHPAAPGCSVLGHADTREIGFARRHSRLYGSDNQAVGSGDRDCGAGATVFCEG
jgi:hypothetical protein